MARRPLFNLSHELVRPDPEGHTARGIDLLYYKLEDLHHDWGYFQTLCATR